MPKYNHTMTQFSIMVRVLWKKPDFLVFKLKCFCYYCFFFIVSFIPKIAFKFIQIYRYFWLQRIYVFPVLNGWVWHQRELFLALNIHVCAPRFHIVLRKSKKSFIIMDDCLWKIHFVEFAIVCPQSKNLLNQNEM